MKRNIGLKVIYLDGDSQNSISPSEVNQKGFVFDINDLFENSSYLAILFGYPRP